MDHGRSSRFYSYDRVKEFQASFMETVHLELERLVQQGIKKEEGIEILLKKIRSLNEQDFPLPTDREVST